MSATEGLGEFSTGQLLQELNSRKDQLVTPDGGVVSGLYLLWAAFKPIPSVDMILARQVEEGIDEIGVIMRATGSERGHLALIGGGINKNEPKIDTMARHLSTDLGIRNFRLIPPQDSEHPFYCAEYMHKPWFPGIDHLFDPGKHSVATTYLLQTDDVITPRNEAGAVVWLREGQVPERTAYNQGILMRAAFDYLRNQPRLLSN